MKKIVGVLAALGLALAMPLTAAAAEWRQTNGRWWYSMDGGRYPVNGWMWIDGDRNGIAECYYFDQAGYILQNTLTPDHCRVNGNGAWVDYNGRVYTRKVTVSNSAASGSAFQTEAERQEVLRLVNEERTKRGLEPLTTDPVLESVADQRAQEIVQLFSHNRPNGQSYDGLYKERGVTGYGYWGENIAMGQSNAKAVVTAWMNSEGHRENILKPEYRKIGVGVYYLNDTPYWVQNFGGY
nr:CAP domain-containing protein [uncultured Stomatobaculum sp.]